MKKKAIKIIRYTALNLIIGLPFASFAVAEQAKNVMVTTAVTPITDKKVALTKHKLLVDSQKQVLQEAKDAVLEIRKALVELDNKNAKMALAALKLASTNLDMALKKNPNMAILPVDIQVDVEDFNGDNNTISKATAEADKLLNNGQLQEARKILAVLASEMRTTTTSLPFGVLAEAVKKAQSLIGENTDEKTTEASVVLNDALNMLVKTIDVIPLPILRAEGYLTEASILEHTQDLKQEKVRESVLKFTDDTKTQLKQAELLGYGGKDDYQVLYKAIDEIKDTMASEKSTATWDNIKKKLTELKNKLTFTKK